MDEPLADISPLPKPPAAGEGAKIRRGQEILQKGGVGALMAAGGQGTRLNHNGPKGSYPLSCIKGKSLFQIFAEKTHAASHLYGNPLPLAIMTSPLNHEETVAFFQTRNYFGLQKEQISFFCQETLPFLDDMGNPAFDSAGNLLQGPAGNGSALHDFYRSGLFQNWRDRGVRYLNFFFVDNPLVDPFDAEMAGAADVDRLDICIKTIERQDGQEKVGLLVKMKGGIRVIEYTEFPSDLWQKREGGDLVFQLVNIGNYTISMDFIENSVRHIPLNDLPLHKVRKSARPHMPLLWKCERYIFDLFPHASSIGAILAERMHCYAPLKNTIGCNSIASVRKALQMREKELYEQIAGVSAPQGIIELAADFYYPTASFVQKHRGRFTSEYYIE